MISTINEAVVALSRSVELSILGKATLMLVIGLIVVKLAGRARASVRHLLLTATFATVFALPLIALTAPEVTIAVSVAQAREPVPNITAVTPSVVPLSTTSSSQPNRATEHPSWSAPSWITIVRLVWVAGAILLLLQLGVDLWRLYRIRRDGLPWTERRELMQSLTAECGIRRSVEILLHEGILAPLTYGIWRPAILLPNEACEWSEADLRRAIVHELEHVRRGDWVIQLAARVTCVFYWFHPLVWVAFRWLSLQAERACDDAVVRGSERTEYAEQLVLLAGRLSKAQAHPALGMANRSDLSSRVSALLDGSQRRGRAGLLAAASALSVASLVALAIAPVRAVTLPTKLTAAAQAPGSQNKNSQKRISSALDRALMEAAEDGDIAGIDELLSAGAKVNSAIDGDGSPLIVAAREGHIDAVRHLLDRGADPDMAVPGDGNALIRAAGEGHEEVVTLLLDRGARIDQMVPGDENALIQASRSGHLNIVKLLVSRGADVNARAWAVRGEDVVFYTWKSTKELKGRGPVVMGAASMYKSDDGGKTWVNKEIMTLEKATAAQANETGGEWRTPLSEARRNGHEAIVAFLLAAGARE